MAAFDYRQAEEIRDRFAEYGVRYLFIGKSGAILLGFPDTTQDADVFPERSAENGGKLVRALRVLGFGLSESEAAEIGRIASKEATNRAKDRESLPRLRSFREYWLIRNR